LKIKNNVWKKNEINIKAKCLLYGAVQPNQREKIGKNQWLISLVDKLIVEILVLDSEPKF
jgi:hypothetical protein